VLTNTIFGDPFESRHMLNVGGGTRFGHSFFDDLSNLNGISHNPGPKF